MALDLTNNFTEDTLSKSDNFKMSLRVASEVYFSLQKVQRMWLEVIYYRIFQKTQITVHQLQKYSVWVVRANARRSRAQLKPK